MSAIRIELELVDGSFVSGMLRAGQSVDGFKKELARLDPHFRKLTQNGEDVIKSFRRMDGESKTLFQHIKDGSIALSAMSFAFRALSGASNGTIGNIVRINSEMERLRYQMAGMSDAADPMKEAGENIQYIMDVARQAPFSAQELTKTFVKLRTAGIDPTNGSMQSLIDGIAAFGGTDESLHRITLGITQMAGKGVIQMEELRQQLGESMPSAMKLMARSMGVSIADLTKMISTGRVEAQSALKKFFEETNRTYGGTAEMMMQTFSGQMARIKTNFIDLVTGGPQRTGEMAVAFDKLKEVMGDIADGLKSKEAHEFFDAIGMGAQTAIEWARKLFDAFVTMKNWLVSLGPLIPTLIGGAAIGLAATKTLSLITRMRAGWQTLITPINQVSLAIANLKAGASIGAMSAAGIVNNAADASAAAILAAQQRNASVAVQSMAGSVAAGGNKIFGPLLATAGRFLGMLGPIALGVGVIAPLAWEVGKGVYSWWTGADKAKDGVDAVNRSMTETLRLAQANEEASIMDQIAAKERDIARYVDEYNRDNPGMLRQLEALWNKRDEMKKRHAQEMASAQEEDAKVEIEEARKRVDAAMQEARKNYRIAQDKNTQQFEAENAAQVAAGKSGRQAVEDYHERLREIEGDRLRAAIAANDAEITSIRNLVEQGKLHQSVLTTMQEDRMRLQDELSKLSDKEYTIELLLGTESEEKKFERLTNKFESAKDKVQELGAELNGASGEVARLAYQIKRGDFGRLDDSTDGIEQLRDALMEATIQSEALQEALDAVNSVESDWDRVLENLQEKNLKLKAELAGIDTTDEYDFLKWKRDTGADGLGRDVDAAVKTILDKVTKDVDVAFSQFEELGTTIQTKAFGKSSLESIQRVGQALANVKAAVGGINQALLDINFGKLGETMPDRSQFDGSYPTTTGQRGFLDTVAKLEGTDYKPGAKGYNTTLDYDRWTGPLDLVNMTLAEVRAVQAKMLMNPQNIAMYGDGKAKGSSALGRYQIVGATLQDAMDRLQLDPNALFDEKMQDMLALWLMQNAQSGGRKVGDVWQGVKVAGPEAEARAMALFNGSSAPVAPQAPVIDQAPIRAGVESGINRINEIEGDAGALDAENDLLQVQANIQKLTDEMLAKSVASDAAVDDESVGTNLKRILEAIAAGEIGPNKDVNAAEYKELLDLARELDATDAQRKQNRKDEGEISREQLKLDEDLVEAARRREEALKRASDPNSFGMSDEMAKLIEQEKEYLALVERRHGKNSQIYKDEADRMARQRSALASAEGAELYADAMEDTRSREDDLRKPQEARRVAMERDIAAAEARAQRMRQLGMDEIAITEWVEREKAAIRAQYNREAMTPMQQQFKEWGDIQTNMQNTTAQWADNAASGVAGLITGTGDLRSVVDGMLNDVANMAVRYAFSGFGSKGGAAAKGSKGSKGAKGAKGAGVVAGVRHTGGMAGTHGSSRVVSANTFAGAPKFHTGGIIGGKAMGLKSYEVPIIAKKGEGVFTPEQMKHLGGFQQNQAFTINAPVTVNASGGTSAQNADLAKQISAEMDMTMRAVVQQELQRQMRPGAMLNKGR